MKRYDGLSERIAKVLESSRRRNSSFHSSATFLYHGR